MSKDEYKSGQPKKPGWYDVLRDGEPSGALFAYAKLVYANKMDKAPRKSPAA